MGAYRSFSTMEKTFMIFVHIEFSLRLNLSFEEEASLHL
jgi:hypothetical protein